MGKNGNSLDRVEAGMEKFSQPPGFMNLMVGVHSNPLFVISQRFIKNNGFLYHLYGDIYYPATGNGD